MLLLTFTRRYFAFWSTILCFKTKRGWLLFDRCQCPHNCPLPKRRRFGIICHPGLQHVTAEWPNGNYGLNEMWIGGISVKSATASFWQSIYCNRYARLQLRAANAIPLFCWKTDIAATDRCPFPETSLLTNRFSVPDSHQPAFYALQRVQPLCIYNELDCGWHTDTERLCITT